MIGPFAARLAAAAAAALLLAGPPALAQSYVETPLFAERVGKGELPPVAERLPKEPLVVDLAAKGRSVGKPGGEVTTLVPRARDIRYMSVHSYARLVGYTEKLALKPDLLRELENEDDHDLHLPAPRRPSLVGRPARSRPRTSATTGRTSRTTRSSRRPASPSSCSSTASRRASRSSTSARSATAGTSRTRASCRSSPGRATPSSTGRRTT